MVALGAGDMIPIAPDLFEILRAELVEGLARMVNRAMRSGKAEVQSVLDQIESSRATLAAVPSINDFLLDLDAAERVLCLYLLPDLGAARMRSNTIALGYAAAKFTLLEIACCRC